MKQSLRGKPRTWKRFVIVYGIIIGSFWEAFQHGIFQPGNVPGVYGLVPYILVLGISCYVIVMLIASARDENQIVGTSIMNIIYLELILGGLTNTTFRCWGWHESWFIILVAAITGMGLLELIMLHVKDTGDHLE